MFTASGGARSRPAPGTTSARAIGRVVVFLVGAGVLSGLLGLSPEPADADVHPRSRAVPQRSPPPLWRRRGPLEIREEWLLAQARLSLPPTTPDLPPPGCTVWRVAFNRGNDFGWNQNETGETPIVRRFIVDGEHQTMALELEHGFRRGFSIGARVPVHWRGAGFLDGLIDWSHDVTGAMDNLRRDFRNDRYRIEGLLKDGGSFSWDERGWGLGNAEISVRAGTCGRLGRRPVRLALIGRMTLPTGTGPFEVGGVDFGAQAVAGLTLLPRLDLYAGAGATWFGEREVDSIEYRRLRPQSFLTLEWQVLPRVSVVAGTTWAGRLIENVRSYPSLQWTVDAGLKIDLDAAHTLEIGITENLEDQQSTVDFGAYAALTWRH